MSLEDLDGLLNNGLLAAASNSCSLKAAKGNKSMGLVMTQYAI